MSMTKSFANLFTITGKTALVTGASSGIGAFMATVLGEAGAKLILVGRRHQELNDTLASLNGITVPMDLIQEKSIEQLVTCCEQANLKPDIIINAAGVNPRQSAEHICPQTWQQTLHLNLSVPFLIAQAFVPHMLHTGWGRIINIASLQSFRAFTNGIAYGAAKGGLVQLTRAMAEAWSSSGVNANAIVPGFFPTALTQAIFADKKIANYHAQQTAIGRNGKLEDLSGALLFFASDASNYVTGQTLAVDGGYTAK